MSKQKTVVVGMSGGVDSSVVALLLKKKGYRVIGLFMKNWEEKNEEGQCNSAQDHDDASSVAQKLNIPFYTVNFVEEYKEQVFSEFLADCRAGLTPNPDILCNREIKFDCFLKKAIELGADYLATGHYCQTDHKSLYKGKDLNKDQSYFVYTLKKEVLSKVLFPIGGLEKSEVRKIAKENDLITHNKKDSTGICFIGKRNFKPFLSQFLGFSPGNFETINGEVIGSHDGLAYYTIGQRKGLGIGGEGDAWYVVDKNPKKNTCILVQGHHHPALYSSHLVATDLSWVSDQHPPLPYTCKAKVRYRQEEQPCTITKIEDDRAYIVFHTPQRAVTEGQAIVFYEEELCLGGGKIISVARQTKPLPALTQPAGCLAVQTH